MTSRWIVLFAHDDIAAMDADPEGWRDAELPMRRLGGGSLAPLRFHWWHCFALSGFHREALGTKPGCLG